MDNFDQEHNLNSRLWIFGYGSLCWNPGFEFNRTATGFVSGYSRKFWQGNTTHRGTISKPGRVATLVDDDTQSTVWGCAYEISGETALSYLTNRECKLGGYMTKFTTFYPRETTDKSSSSAPPFMVMLYVATSKNDLWLGDAPLCNIADQITECSGQSGHNVEYLLRLAEFMRNQVPEAVDDHLFALEHLVRVRIKERNMCIRTLMGDSRGLRTLESASNGNASPERDQVQEALPGALERVDSFQFTARVPHKNLRCLNI